MSLSACGVEEEPKALDSTIGLIGTLEESSEEQEQSTANLTSAASCNASGNFATFNDDQVWIWNASAGQWSGVIIYQPSSLIDSCGNYAVISGNAVYVWSKSTSQWSGVYLSSPAELIGSEGNFAVFGGGQTWVWNASTNQWSGLSLTSPSVLAGTEGNFAVISKSGGLAYIWSKVTSQWNGVYISSPDRLIGDGGNFVMTNSQTAWVWNSATSQWYGLSISSPSDLASTGGNFAVVSRNAGLAYAWNRLSNQWNGVVIQAPKTLLGEDGNFAVMSSGPTGQALAWNSSTGQWYGLTIHQPITLAASRGNFAVISSTYAHAWNKATNQWSWVSVSPTKELVGSEGSFAVRCNQQAWVWNAASNLWHGITIPASNDSSDAMTGSGGNFALTTAASGGVTYIWNKATTLWSGIYISSPRLLIGDDGNFGVLTAQSVGQAWTWSSSTNQWYGVSVPLLTNMVGSRGNFAVISYNWASAWNKATNQWSWGAATAPTELVGSEGNFAATSDQQALAWNASSSQWYGVSVSSPGKIVAAGGGFAVTSSSSGLAYAWNKAINQWYGLYISSPRDLLGSADENGLWHLGIAFPRASSLTFNGFRDNGTPMFSVGASNKFAPPLHKSAGAFDSETGGFLLDVGADLVNSGVVVRGDNYKQDPGGNATYQSMEFDLHTNDFFAKNPAAHIVIAPRALLPYKVNDVRYNNYPPFENFRTSSIKAPYAYGDGIIIGSVPCKASTPGGRYRPGGSSISNGVAQEIFIHPNDYLNDPKDITACSNSGQVSFANNATYKVKVFVKQERCPTNIYATCRRIGYNLRRVGAVFEPEHGVGGNDEFVDETALVPVGPEGPTRGWSALQSHDRSSWFIAHVFTTPGSDSSPGSGTWSFQIDNLRVSASNTVPAWWISP